MRKKTSEEFVKLLESRLPKQMEGHGIRVGKICEELLESFSYPKRKRDTLVGTAVLHDIGKALLSAHLFHKKGALSLTEEAEYQAHPDKGAEILLAFTNDAQAAKWVRHHHERYDGKGYPDQLKQSDIPLESRILAVCNTLDHLMLQHLDDDAVYQALLGLSGKSLDPALVSACTRDTITHLRQILTYSAAQEKESLSHFHIAEDTTKEPVGYIGKTYMLRYADGSLSEVEDDIPQNQIVKLAEQAWHSARSFHEVITYQDLIYECHFYCESSEVRIFIIDITPILGFREKLQSSMLRSYQDMIETLSHGKINICLDERSIESQLGDLQGTMNVQVKGDVPLSRSFASKFIRTPLDDKKLMNIKLAVTEGVTNMIKHASEGRMAVFVKEGVLQVLIADHGSGIPLHELPKTILVSGYSSKRSLGRGFPLMCSSSDRVFIYTSSRGTSLLLEFKIDTGSAEVPHVVL
ncbi:HD domain-containing phosphohydrolase [Paenibacillus xanthanilyticus]|uniref:HD domain-containing phosphohydrolase n=1 Tax=Paenibacillus xanthanilyticus TaxID=1783531 RepID=A0ABV8K1E2_9BACL